MKKFILVVLFFLLVILVCSWLYFGKTNTNTTLIGQKKYHLTIARTEQQRAQGLSNKPSLNHDEAMLFLFETPDRYPFWMKEMRFPLDFIFVRGPVVVDTLENVPVDSYPNTFTSKVAFDGVIELNANEVKNNQVKRGDFIIFDQTWRPRRESNTQPTP